MLTERGNWYTALPRRDRKTVDAAAKWLRTVEWQFFVTLTFPWNVRSETAVRKLRALINGLERHHRTTVSFVAGQECRSRHDGSRIPWHFHLLLTCRVLVSVEALECLWLALIQPRTRAEGQHYRDSEHILIEPYQEHERGPEYCLKAIGDATGDWHIHGLENCLPGVPCTARPNHRTVRRERRANAAANAEPGAAAQGGRNR